MKAPARAKGGDVYGGEERRKSKKPGDGGAHTSPSK